MFKNCHSAYKIIQTTYDREAEDTGRMRVILDALDKTRYLCGELQEKFKVFERNYFVSVSILSINLYFLESQKEGYGKDKR
jgi:hypothetical protein